MFFFCVFIYCLTYPFHLQVVIFRVFGSTGFIKTSTVPSLRWGFFFFIYCLSLICFTYKYSSQHYSNVADVKTFVATHTIPSLHSASPARITSLAVSLTIHSHGYNGEYSILPTYAPRALSLSLAYWLLAAPTLSDYNLCRVELDINDRI